MIVQFYKPNANNTGFAASFDIGNNNKNQEPFFFVNVIKQYSWNNKTRTGSFSENRKDPDKNIRIKLNENEIGGLIHAIEKDTEFSAFHSYEDNKTSISFKPYKKKDGTSAFSLGLVRNSANQFSLSIEIRESYNLLEFCKFYLQELYIHRLTNNNSLRNNE